jgi:hypothetical protein
MSRIFQNGTSVRRVGEKDFIPYLNRVDNLNIEAKTKHSDNGLLLIYLAIEIFIITIELYQDLTLIVND